MKEADIKKIMERTGQSRAQLVGGFDPEMPYTGSSPYRVIDTFTCPLSKYTKASFSDNYPGITIWENFNLITPQ